MLILSRNCNEAVVIDGKTKLAVLTISGKQAVLGLCPMADTASPGKDVYTSTHRKSVGDKLAVCDKVTVSVLGMRGRQVRLGFEAPPSVAIHREEIHDDIMKKQAQKDARVQPVRNPFKS